MNAEIRSTTQFLATVAAARDRLIALARSLESHPAVTKVTHWSECPALESGARIEEFVDAELQSGNAISWSLEIALYDGSWHLEADIRIIHATGQDRLVEFPERDGSQVPELLCQIEALTAQLADAARADALLTKCNQTIDQWGRELSPK